MANSIGGLNLTVAQTSLDQLVSWAPFLDSFMTNISNGNNVGSKITTRLPTSTVVAHNSATGFTFQNATASAVDVTFEQKDAFHAFTELEWSNMGAEFVQNNWLPTQVRTIVNDVAVSASVLVTTANYANYVSSSVLGFSGSAVFNLGGLLSTAKVPVEGRSLIITPDMYSVLLNSVSPQYIYGSTDIIKGYRNSSIAGFTVFEYPALPANGETLKGFGCHKSAFAYAFKEILPPSNPSVQYSNASDPKTGMSVQVRLWHDPDGYIKFGPTACYGSAKGNGSSLYRIITG